MPIYEIVFYAFSLVMLAGAVMVITVRNSCLRGPQPAADVFQRLGSVDAA